MLGWLRAVFTFSLFIASVLIGAVFAAQNTAMVPLCDDVARANHGCLVTIISCSGLSHGKPNQ